MTDEQGRDVRLERARILAAKVVLVLLVASVGTMIVQSFIGAVQRLDIGVVVTLLGGELGLVAAGPIVRLVGLK